MEAAESSWVLGNSQTLATAKGSLFSVDMLMKNEIKIQSRKSSAKLIWRGI